MIDRRMGRTEWALLVALSVLWGGSFFFVEVAVRELPPLTVVVARVGLAALALHLLVRALREAMPRAPRIWAAFLGMGLLNNAVPFTLFVWAQTHIPSGLASILNATTPLFTVLVAHLATADERMTANRLAGVAVGFAGVAVMLGGGRPFGVDVLAELAALAGAFSYALAGVFGRRFRALGVSPLATATGQVTASALLMLPIMLVLDQPWTLPAPGLSTLAALAGLALLSTALGYVIYFRILAQAGATNLLLVTFLIPPSAILLGATVLGERLEPRHFGGMALIAVGLAAIDGRPLERLRGLLRRAR